MLFKEDATARAQHQAVRENAGWYRWTHDLVKVTGPDADAFVDWLFVNTVGKAAVGSTKYTTMLNESREYAKQRMIQQAQAMGADAVVCVRYTTSAVVQGAAEMLAYGTAVKFI